MTKNIYKLSDVSISKLNYDFIECFVELEFLSMFNGNSVLEINLLDITSFHVEVFNGLEKPSFPLYVGSIQIDEIKANTNQIFTNHDESLLSGNAFKTTIEGGEIIISIWSKNYELKTKALR